MAYSAEVVRRARQRLAQAKQERETVNQEHLLRAYEAAPRLKEIDRQLKLTMVQAARAAFAGGDAPRIMDQARQENQALQREREQILRTTFEPGYLDETPVCEKCGGSGYIGSQMCQCLQALCREEQCRELTSLPTARESFDRFRLEYYPNQVDPKTGYSPRILMEKTYQTCRKYAASFSNRSENLLFSGNTGLGKTFLSSCIAWSVADRGFSVVYEGAAHLFHTMELARFNATEESRKAAEKYSLCDLLILDDLGTELAGQFVTAALYTLIDDRLLANRPTIISTNLPTEELSSRYSPQIASRLRGSYRRVAFVGEDIRLLLK